MLKPCCLLRCPDFAKSFFTAIAVERRFCVVFPLFLTSGFCCKRLSTSHCFGPLAVLSLSLSLSRDSFFSISSRLSFLLSRLLSEEKALLRSASDARTVSCSFQSLCLALFIIAPTSHCQILLHSLVLSLPKLLLLILLLVLVSSFRRVFCINVSYLLRTEFALRLPSAFLLRVHLEDELIGIGS